MTFVIFLCGISSAVEFILSVLYIVLDHSSGNAEAHQWPTFLVATSSVSLHLASRNFTVSVLNASWYPPLYLIC
jgi:hypothetical protein